MKNGDPFVGSPFLTVAGYLPLGFDGRWLRALPAADLESLPVRPSFRTFDAAEAAFLLVSLFANRHLQAQR